MTLNNQFAKLSETIVYKMKSYGKIISTKASSGYYKSKLRNNNFTIICNNCLSWGIYKKVGLRYSTPTIGIFFFSEDYIKFLENLEYYIKQPLKFTENSRHPAANEARKTRQFPTGKLDEVEIQFWHYKTETEAEEKWNKRIKLINFDNIFIIYSDRHQFKEDHLERFEKLPFKHKIFFSAKPRLGNPSVVFLKEYENKMEVPEMTRFRNYEKYIDVIKWLNGERNFLKKKP
jgi:uncharacterized protein (DUF1919 family)